MQGTDDLRNSPKLIRRWTRRWGVPALAGEITCQWSPRLRRSLGRAYAERKLIRLSLSLQEPQFASLFEEVLCHEAGHIVAFHLHGCRVADHGPAWEKLVRLAGRAPRRYCETDSLPQREDPDSAHYIHICQATRTAQRPQQ